MATLIPAVQVRNTGGCHVQEVRIDPDQPEARRTEALAEQTAKALMAAQIEGCSKTLDDTVPEGHRGLRLEFDPAMWREAP